jgi:hypothetical protein
MNDEERQTNKFRSGIGMPPFKAPEMRRVLSNVIDANTTPAVDSSLKSEDDDDFFKELDEGIERRKRADWIRKNHEVVKAERKASEHECIREEESGRLQEAQAQLEQMERMVRETQEQNRQLREALAQKTTGGMTPSVGFTTPKKTGRGQMKSHATMIRGSPVDKRVYKEGPDGYVATGLYESDGSPIWGVPKNKGMKLQLAKFSAKETHKGLGTGVNEWVNRFVRQLERAQVASGCCWPEEVKMDVLEAHLEGKTLDYW